MPRSIRPRAPYGTFPDRPIFFPIRVAGGMQLGPVRTAQQWHARNPGKTWRANAKAYARVHMVAAVLLADGRCIMYAWRPETARLHQRTYPAGSFSFYGDSHNV